MSAEPAIATPEPLEETTVGNLPVGARLGAYELGRVLGRGGMGAVYEATHRAVQKRVAIKTLLPHLAASKSSTQRFLREAQAAARVRHPHTVDVTDVGVADGIPFIVMEYLDGENLAQRIDREGPMSAEAVVDLMLPVCSALMTAHAEGVVHRDLKPENIFIARTRAESEVVKVLDFGISHIAQPPGEVRLTQTNSVIGTPHYMSPEQTKGARFAEARSDQYSVGVVMYECLTTELPFDGDSFLEVLQALATKKVIPPSKHVRGIPSGLDALVLRTLSKDPKKRFESMRDLARALLPFASTRGRVVWEAAFAEGAPKLSDPNTLQIRRDSTIADRAPVRPLWPLVAVAVGLAFVVCLGVGLYLGGSPEAATPAIVRPPSTFPTTAQPAPGPSDGEEVSPATVLVSPAPAGGETIDLPAVPAVEDSVPIQAPPPSTPPVRPVARPAAPFASSAASRPAVTGGATQGSLTGAGRPGTRPLPREPVRPRVGPNGAAILR